jgi:hypothetical protein
MKKFYWIVYGLVCLGCSRDEMPYEETFKKTVIRNINIEPIVESVLIEKSYDSIILYRYWNDRMLERKRSIKDETYSDLIKAKDDYSRALKVSGKSIADGVYLHYVKEYQEKYNNIERDIYTDDYLKIYHERIELPSIFEQITIKYRMSESGPLLVGRYRTDIFKGDTSFYELKSDQTLKDYINGK